MIFEKLFSKLPTVKAQEEEEELQDPQQILRVTNKNYYLILNELYFLPG